MEEQLMFPISTALKEFQDSLDPSQQAELLALHGATIPDGNTVLAFTAEVDRKRCNARCVASRLQGTLQSVQQFTQIVSTFVSSNPAIAALIWGSIRFTILVASNFSSFFDKLSEWFMKLHHVCPRLSEYKFIYADSVRLQNTLCSFYATLIRFCTKAMVAMKRTGLQRITKALWDPFENEFSECTSSLHRLHKELQAEIRLASDQAAFRERELQMIERKRAENDRKFGRAFFGRASQFVNEEKDWRLQVQEKEEQIRKQRVLDQLSSHNHVSPLIRLRKRRYGDTGLWLNETQEYLKWIDASSNSVFWLHGILGSGKSVITSAVIDDLLRRVTDDAVKLLFFFVEHDESESLQSRNILRCLLRQCLTVGTLSEKTESMAVHIAKDSTRDPNDFVQVFRSLLKMSRVQMYIVIDGFDEASSDDRDFVLTVLKGIALADLGLKVFIASRHDIGSQLESKFHITLERSTNCTELDEDISKYINLSIEEKYSSGQLVVGDLAILDKIREALRKKAKRMFLWVFFQIEDICSQICDHDIVEVLENLPSSLLETYERIFLKITKDGKVDVVKRLFEWIAAAERPLNLPELREAIAIYPGQPYSMPNRQVNDTKSIISWCRSLVTLDEDEQTVQFAHYTIKDFLTSSSSATNGVFQIDLDKTRNFVGEICCTYLAFSDFKRQLIRLDNSTVSLEPKNLVKNTFSTNNASLITNSWSALQKLRKVQPTGLNDANVYRHLQILALDKGFNSLPKLQDDPQLLAYASQFWMSHTRGITPESVSYRIWMNLMFGSEMPGAKGWNTQDLDVGANHIIESIVDNNHKALLKLLIDTSSKKYDSTQQPENLPKVLKWIARTGTLDLFDMLCNAYPGMSLDLWEATFDCAVFGNQEAIMRRLLQGEYKKSESPIVITLKKEHFVWNDQQLHVHKFPAPFKQKSTHLIEAFLFHVREYETLEGILKIQEGYHYDTMRSEKAIPKKHFDSLYKFLLLNFCVFDLILHEAVETGDIDAAEECLSSCADPNSVLVAACQRMGSQHGFRYQTEIVQMLLQAGADPNYEDCNHETPLAAAIESANSEVILLLLRHGAKPLKFWDPEIKALWMRPERCRLAYNGALRIYNNDIGIAR